MSPPHQRLVIGVFPVPSPGMVRLVIAGMLLCGAVALLVVALLNAGPTSGEVLSAVGLVIIAGLNLVGTGYSESRRRARKAEALGGSAPARTRREREPRSQPPPPTSREPALAAMDLSASLEALARKQEAEFGPRSTVDVILLNPGRNKIAVIKALREGLGTGLREAKDMADRSGREPVLLASSMPAERAREFSRALQSAGAQVRLR
jgi:large subunit ribosomal protein L7/L12